MQTEYLDSSVQLIREQAQVKRCPECFSVFVTDESCESCGLQLNFQRLGRPFGRESFYFLRESFEESIRVFGLRYTWPRIGYQEMKEDYLRGLFRRYRSLLNYFGEHQFEYGEFAAAKVYLAELDLLVQEFSFYEGSKEELQKCLDEIERPKSLILSQRVYAAFEIGQRERLNKEQDHWAHRKYYGLISLGQVLRVLILTFFVVATSLGIFRVLSL